MYELLFEDQSTKCPACKGALSWKSHVKRWEQDKQVHEFTFRCEPCKNEYLFKDDQVIEKRLGTDPVAETIAIQNGQLQDALQRRCLKCGGPITSDHASSPLRCDWCNQEYKVNEGELQPKITLELRPKPSMREFYAIHR